LRGHFARERKKGKRRKKRDARIRRKTHTNKYMVTALVSAIYVDNEMQARRRLENKGAHAEMKVNGLADADAAACC